jgi:hypothetical protein
MWRTGHSSSRMGGWDPARANIPLYYTRLGENGGPGTLAGLAVLVSGAW